MIHLPRTTHFTRAQKQKQSAYAWATVALSALSAASFVALALDNLLVPFTVLFCIALPILLWRLPRLVLYLTLGAACLIELGASGSPDALTDRIPFFWNINTIFQVYAHVNLKAAPINFFELFVLVAGLCSLFRSVFSGTAKVRGGDLWIPIAVYIGFVTLAWINGITSGGDFKISLQEVRGQFYFFLTYLTAVNVVQDRKQVKNLLWVSVACVAVKGALYTFRRYVTLGGQPLPDQGVGSHEEAFFFDLFVLLLASLALFNVHKKMQWFMVLVLPLVLLGNLATNRRAGTADIALMIPVLFMAAYAGLPKRRGLIGIVALVACVLGFGYYQVGKTKGGAWAQPARAIHSQFAPNKRDLDSNVYREAENYNQMATVHAYPLGYGYGKPFLMAVPMVDIADEYIFWNILPHNQMLWVWMRTGTTGFYAFWIMITIFTVYAGRLIRDEANDNEIKMLALFALLCVGSLLIFGLLDLQLSNFRDLIFVGVWLGVLARLKHLALLPPSDAGNGEAAPKPRRVSQKEVYAAVRASAKEKFRA